MSTIAQAQFSHNISNGTVIITRYTGPGGAVVIPDSFEGLPVTGIGGGAFRSSTNLTSVAIPESVRSIAFDAFRGCTRLTSVRIPQGVKVIPWAAFYECTSLTSVSIPGSVTNIDGSAFSRCASLPSITLPDSLVTLAGGVFADCTSLERIFIPKNVTTIGAGAFHACTSLGVITVDEFNPAYGSLDGMLFDKSLTSLILCPRAKTGSYVIPGSVTDVRYGAFSGGTSLTAIDVDPLNAAYSSLDGVLFDKSQTSLIWCPGRKTGPYIIPSGVAGIELWAFSGCANLTSVIIPDSVTSIGSRAFSDCTSLASVIIGNGVTSIARTAFAGCTSLRGAYFRGNAPSFDRSYPPFSGAYRVTIYYLPGSVVWEEMYAYRPTALWANPVVLEGSIQAEGNAFGFTIAWASDISVVVEAATTLTAPTWSPASTNVLNGGVLQFSDSQRQDHPARFYRLRSP